MLARLVKTIAGAPESHPSPLVEAFPELRLVRLRRGGLFPRIGGWCLGQATVAGITIGRTVWLGAHTTPTAELLLHELRHVYQFQRVPAFPLQYVWETLRRGYQNNRFEVDARRYAAAQLRRSLEDTSSEGS